MTAAVVSVLGEVISVPVGLVDPGRNWRGTLRNVEQLAESIRKVGLREPITVVDVGDGRYQVFEGHRRLAAVGLLGWTHIAAIVRRVDEQHRALLQLAIHAQREDFDPIAQAEALAFALFEQEGPKPSREEAAQAIGKSPGWVAGRLQLLNLPARERDDVSARRLSVAGALQLLKDRASAGRPSNYRPSKQAVTGSSAVVSVVVESPAEVTLRRVAALVGDCVGCACCRAVAEVLAESA